MYLSSRRLLVPLSLGATLLVSTCGPGAVTTNAPVPASTSTRALTVPTPTSLPSATKTASITPSTIPTAAPAATALPTVAAAATPSPAGSAENGKKLFDSLPCSSCHDDTHPLPGGVVCPNLGNIASEAARIVQSSDYHGKAIDPAGYIRESIVDPNAYIVPGPNYHTNDGESVMEKDFAQILTPSQVDDLVAYLMTKQ